MTDESDNGGMVKLSREVTYGLLVLNFVIFMYEQFMVPQVRMDFEQRFALSIAGVRAGIFFNGWLD